MLYLINLMTVSRTTWPMTWHPLKMLLISSWQTRRPKPRQSPKLLPRWWKDQMLRRSSRSLPSTRPHHHQASPGMAIMGYHQLRAHLVVWDAGQRQNVVPIVESQPLKAWGLPTGLSGRHGRMPKIARRSEEHMHFHCWPISFGVRQPIVCQWGYTCPCQWSWKSYLILPANALLFVFNPQHFCFQPTSGLGRTRSIECWLPKSKPTCHKGAKKNGPGWWPWSREPWRWRPWPMGQTIGIPQARSTSGIGPHQAWAHTHPSQWAFTPQCVQQLDMAVEVEVPRSRGHTFVAPQSSPWKCQTRRTPCQLTNHEEGATNAQRQRAQAPALLMQRCVSSMTRLPACLAIFGTPISHFVAIRFTRFVFFVRTHVFSWVDRSYATTKLFLHRCLCICVSIWCMKK